MAGSSNFKVFDETQTNIMDDSAYNESTYRKNGAVSGIAPSNVHNKLYRQTSVMAAALAQAMANKGYTVSDANFDNLVTVLDNIMTDIADNSVTDAKIGNRTITDTVTAAAGAGTITNLLSKIGNMIKQITGKSAWYTAPATTLQALSDLIVSTPGANKLLKLDANSKLPADITGNAVSATNATNHIAATSGAHTASAITQDASNRFVSDTEKNTWNGKASTAVVSTSADGLCPKRDGTTTKYLRADGTWQTPPDTVYTHPASHPASMITGLPTSLPANGGNAATVGGYTAAQLLAAAGFDSGHSFAVNGYQKFSNGLIIQWGRGTVANIVFPVAFPTACFSVQLTEINSVSTSGSYDKVTNITTNGFSKVLVFDAFWFAIGY